MYQSGVYLTKQPTHIMKTETLEQWQIPHQTLQSLSCYRKAATIVCLFGECLGKSWVLHILPISTRKWCGSIHDTIQCHIFLAPSAAISNESHWYCLDPDSCKTIFVQKGCNISRSIHQYSPNTRIILVCVFFSRIDARLVLVYKSSTLLKPQ